MENETLDGASEESTSTPTPEPTEMGRQMALQRAEEQVQNDAVEEENKLILGKYKDYDALEKAHLHQSKFVGQKHSEFVGAPEGAYEYKSPYESVDIDISQGPLQAWASKAKEMNLSPEGFKQITDTFTGIQAEMQAAAIKAQEATDEETYAADIATFGGELAAEEVTNQTMLHLERYMTGEDATKIIQDCSASSLIALARTFKDMDYSAIPDDPSLGHRGITRQSVMKDKMERNQLVKEGKISGKALQDLDAEIYKKFEVLAPGNYKS